MNEWLVGLLDDPLRSQGPRATEATAQNNSEMDEFAPCHDREISPGPAQTNFDVQKRGENGHLVSELDERLRSQGPRASAGDEQNTGAKHHFRIAQFRESSPVPRKPILTPKRGGLDIHFCHWTIV